MFNLSLLSVVKHETSDWCHDRLPCDFDGAHDGPVVEYFYKYIFHLLILLIYSVSVDDSNSPRWARDRFENLFQRQQLNEERLGRTEAGLRKPTALEEKERF